MPRSPYRSAGGFELGWTAQWSPSSRRTKSCYTPTTGTYTAQLRECLVELFYLKVQLSSRADRSISSETFHILAGTWRVDQRNRCIWFHLTCIAESHHAHRNKDLWLITHMFRLLTSGRRLEVVRHRLHPLARGFRLLRRLADSLLFLASLCAWLL